MDSAIKRGLYLVSALMFLAGMGAGQVATGTPKFGSFGGSFDAVNLGNLNVHLSVPVSYKAGRGMPFSYALSYDSSIWHPVTSGSTTSWQPVFNWGWQSSYAANSGQITFAMRMVRCPEGLGSFTVTGPYTYIDPWGINHPFPGSWISASSCTTAQSPFPATALDGSGLILDSPNAIAVKVITPGGAILAPPHNLSGGSTPTSLTITDANGNQITANSSGVFTDTLGQSALTIAGAPPSATTFTYTAPSGTNVAASMSYLSYNIKTTFQCSGVQEYNATGVYLVDHVTLPDNSRYAFAYETTPGYPTYTTGRLASVTLPTGGTITYTYNYTDGHNGIVCADGTTDGLTRTLNPGGAWTYSRSGGASSWTTTVTDPASNDTVISFQKDSATTVPTNNFYETARVVKQGSSSTLETIYTCYNGNGVSNPSSCTTLGVASPILRVTAFQEIPNSSGAVSKTDSFYDTLGLIHEVDEYDYAAGGAGALIRKTITAYTALGNGIVDRPSSVTVTDGTNTKAYTQYAYDETTPTATSNTPQHISISGSRGNLTRVIAQANGSTYLYRKYAYYDTGTLSTSTDVSTSGTTNGATTTYNYASGTASCGNSFVTSISEPVGGMSRSFEWDCTGGVLLSVTDESGNTSSTAYNGTNYTNVFWRPYSTTDEAGYTTDYFYYLDASNREFQVESKSHTAFNGGNSIIDHVTTNDGFGRTVFSQTRQGPSGSNYDTVATCYDSVGRVSLTTLPYSTTKASSTTSCPQSNPGTAYTYDGLGRTLAASDSGGGSGSTTYSYGKNDVLQTRSSPSQSRQSEFDALGRLKSVCEVTAGTAAWPSASCGQNTAATGYLTTYGYDALGNLTSVTQNAQASSGYQTRSYVYDMLGRLISETNPETKNAAITYSYDSLTSDAACGTITSAGNLLKRLDAAGNAACYSGYDALHRVGAVMYPSSSTPAKHFVYDTATVNGSAMSNAKTRLAEAYTCIGTCSSKVTDLGFSYWPTGQTSDVWELTPHSGTNYYYRVTSAYWPNGAVNTIGNLVGLPTITYGVDGEGRGGTVSASSGQNPITSVAYNAAGQVTGLTYGSSDSDSFTFYTSTGRMQQYQFSMGTTPVKTDTGVLTWNSNGSLQQLAITDLINSANTQTCNYTHDDLGRIASANCGTAVFNQTFSYDPFGNINKAVPQGSTGTSFQVNYDNTNLTNRITTAPYSYTSTNDPNAKTGNMTADNWHGYGWDTANRLSTVDSGTASGVCITYDALDRVVEQAYGSTCATSPTSAKQIVYSPSGGKLALMNGATLTKAFVPLPGGAQAVYTSSGLAYYRHSDWLGSSRLATTPSRAMYYDGAYAPFGENYAQSGTQDLSFTGQNQDTESSASGGAGGLYDFTFRKHSPVQGRWLSPDPAGLAATDTADPQSWNRYAYVGNRPLGAVDPLGLYPFQPGGPPCDPSVDSCGGGPGSGGCEPDDPSCTPCEPGIDPGCGPSGPPRPNPPPPRPPGGAPGPVTGTLRQGGVWPDNETLGLPGLDTSPLSSGDLLELLPGLGCAGMNVGFSFTPLPLPNGKAERKGPCITLAIPIFVGIASSNSTSDKKPPDGKCSASRSKANYTDLCKWEENGRFVEAFRCEGNVNCCLDLEKVFDRECEHKGKPGQYGVSSVHGMLFEADCCQRW
jgi:RHS repeat-associated protein